MPDEYEYQKNLAEIRQGEKQETKNNQPEKEKSERSLSSSKKNPPQKILNNLKKASATAKAVLFSIELRDVFFIIAIGCAILKDFSDYVGIGSLPIIGTAVTLMTSFTIITGMLVSGNYSSGKRNRLNVKRAIKRWGTLAGGTLAELLFGINFLPLETLTAFITFGLTLLERVKSNEERASDNE